MAKQKVATAGTLIGGIFQVGLYKASQGRITRQVTCGTLWVIIGLCAYRLQQTMFAYGQLQYLVPLLVIGAGGWAAYRLVNYPRFADFLIAVEAEMNKVSWPTRAKLVRSCVVVIFVIFSLAIILFGFDMLWRIVFRFLGVLQ
jgi:preprotein translocase subunit SecE